ncbi:MAG: phosphotransferase [Actinomycetota bacterium]|nr:phosphotransferase [Actinomycetota bacterium]
MLRTHLPQLDDYVAAVVGRVRELSKAPAGLVHGDLVPGNILMVDDVPAALLVFGFRSTVGDPAFDAAVAASVFDMYGPDAEQAEAAVDRAVEARRGRERERVICFCYRAAYAVLTANCFSDAGSDGHFEWCLRILRRPEVRDVLGMPEIEVRSSE